MKIVYAILLFVSLFTTSATFAQSITVYEDDSTTALAGAHVFCRDQQTKTEKIYFADANGKVVFPEMTATNNYELTIYQLGFKKITETVKGNINKVYFLTKEQTSINEVVVTAQFAPNSPEKAVHNIRIIDQKKIAAMGAVNLRDVMMNEANVTITEDAVLGSGFGLQGIQGQNVKILINGVPVVGRSADNVDPSQINMNNVERIEIVQGPLAVSYGTDALAGTINIITKKNTGRSITFNAESYYESIGKYNLNANAGFALKKHHFQFNGGRNYFDGWSAGDKQFYFEFDPVADASRVQTWKPKEQYFGGFNYGYDFKKLKFDYNFDYFYESIHNKGLPDTSATTVVGLDDYYNTHRINNSISLSGMLSKHFRINGVAAFNYFRRNKNTYVKDLTDLQESLSISDGSQDTSVFTSLMSRATISNVNKSSKLNYEVGYDLRHDYSRGARIEDLTQTMDDIAGFVNVEWTPLTDLTIRPGLRAGYNSKYSAPVIPSLNLRYSIHTGANDMVTFRASYSKGFRAPSLKELYFDFVDINHNIVGNKDLKAENSNYFDFSANYIHTNGDLSLKTEFLTYYNNIDNQISLAATDSSGTAFIYFNLDNFKTLGFQLQQTVGFRHIKATAGLYYLGRYNVFSKESNTSEFLYAPEVRFNLYYDWHEKGMTFAAFYKYNGRIPSYRTDASGTITQVENSAYSWADASVSKSLLQKKLDLTIGVKNLFNVTTIASGAIGGAHSLAGGQSSVGSGRGYFVRLAYHFASN